MHSAGRQIDRLVRLRLITLAAGNQMRGMRERVINDQVFGVIVWADAVAVNQHDRAFVVSRRP